MLAILTILIDHFGAIIVEAVMQPPHLREHIYHIFIKGQADSMICYQPVCLDVTVFVYAGMSVLF